MNSIEIFCDASMKTFPDGRVFGCSGAYCDYNKVTLTSINPDTTNNKSELLAVLLGVKLAEQILNVEPYLNITIYSDSKFSIYGLTKWMPSWLKTMTPDGIMFNSSNQPVKNQELFKSIITYITTHKFKIKFLHQSGHVNYKKPEGLIEANQVFFNSNGYYLNDEDILRISIHNNYIDNYTRNMLQNVNPDYYLIMTGYYNNGVQMCRYVIPEDYTTYVY